MTAEPACAAATPITSAKIISIIPPKGSASVLMKSIRPLSLACSTLPASRGCINAASRQKTCELLPSVLKIVLQHNPPDSDRRADIVDRQRWANTRHQVCCALLQARPSPILAYNG